MKRKTFNTPHFNVVLNICTKPEDYVKMFDVQCGSCMVLGPKGFTGREMRLWHEMKDKHNIHPASWYHFTPHSRGVFITIDGVPLARCMQYRDDLTKDEWPFFSDIKYTSYGARDLLYTIMNATECVYIQEKHTNTRDTVQAFEVPGYESSEGVVCPLPHCDFQTKDFSVTYDAERKVFKFWPDKDAPEDAVHIKSTYDHDGYLNSNFVLNGPKNKDLFCSAFKGTYFWEDHFETH